MNGWIRKSRKLETDRQIAEALPGKVAGHHRGVDVGELREEQSGRSAGTAESVKSVNQE